MKQGVLASLLLEPRGYLRNLPNLREHLLQTQSGEHEKRELKRHAAGTRRAALQGDVQRHRVAADPQGARDVMQWKLSKMQTLELSPSASIKDVRSYLKDLDEAVKNADAELSLKEYTLQTLDRADGGGAWAGTGF